MGWETRSRLLLLVENVFAKNTRGALPHCRAELHLEMITRARDPHTLPIHTPSPCAQQPQPPGALCAARPLPRCVRTPSPPQAVAPRASAHGITRDGAWRRSATSARLARCAQRCALPRVHVPAGRACTAPRCTRTSSAHPVENASGEGAGYSRGHCMAHSRAPARTTCSRLTARARARLGKSQFETKLFIANEVRAACPCPCKQPNPEFSAAPAYETDSVRLPVRFVSESQSTTWRPAVR